MSGILILNRIRSPRESRMRLHDRITHQIMGNIGRMGCWLCCCLQFSSNSNHNREQQNCRIFYLSPEHSIYPLKKCRILSIWTWRKLRNAYLKKRDIFFSRIDMFGGNQGLMIVDGKFIAKTNHKFLGKVFPIYLRSSAKPQLHLWHGRPVMAISAISTFFGGALCWQEKAILP